jgi:hypothetical protein
VSCCEGCKCGARTPREEAEALIASIVNDLAKVAIDLEGLSNTLVPEPTGLVPYLPTTHSGMVDQIGTQVDSFMQALQTIGRETGL